MIARRLCLLWLCAASAFAFAAHAADGSAPARGNLPADPLNSPSWKYMRERFLGSDPVLFDARVQVDLPPAAEDQAQVPVMVRAPDLQDVETVLVFADLNPLPKILQYTPLQASSDIGFRFKVEQSTPVRAAMRTRDGVWHVGGAWLRAAGGGCTAPSLGTGQGLWQNRLGEVSARLWPRDTRSERLRFRVIHPMDTGLASGIPAFHLDRIDMLDEHGALLASLQTFEPVSENPVISVDLRSAGKLQLQARDIQGNRFSAQVAP
ncbi:quinoprotein dehydrogenase-associated SoxYZ-like carrier [Hydrocarboniphaga sp.]|uniref:quinoprotein dehydrogenase-associated SoxYZ-like carrier n=1 Tax=Hydrocarboniphaga sp. TaxID=2033016 RepID=UPI003D0B0492